MAVIEVTKEQFAAEVLASEKPVLVDFNASWCGPCKMMKPVLAAFAAENSAVKVVAVDIDEEDELAEEYDVTSVPCLVVFEGGRETNRQVGFRNADQLAAMIGGA